MSTTYLTVTLTDPYATPEPVARAEMLEILREWAESFEELDERSGEVAFVDCGGNFESIACPSCGADVDEDWWGERMDACHETGFRTLAIVMPCCGIDTSLNDLVYRWPQGFASWRIEMRDPVYDTFGEHELRRLESAAGRPIRIIWAHY